MKRGGEIAPRFGDEVSMLPQGDRLKTPRQENMLVLSRLQDEPSPLAQKVRRERVLG